MVPPEAGPDRSSMDAPDAVAPDVERIDRRVPLGVEDAGELLTLQRAAYVTEAQLNEDVRIPPLTQTLEQLRTELTSPNVSAWGLRRGPRLVAAMRLRRIGPGTVELGRLVVAPDVQGGGLGSRLLAEAETLVPPGTTAVHLFTGGRSEGNLRLYRRYGYVETHRTNAGGHELVHMVKQLRQD